MEAAVGVKSAPHRITTDDGTAQPHRWQLGLPDRVAVEAALQTADDVTVIGIGGGRARDTVRSALEMGADHGLQVTYDPIEEAAAEKYATVLARAAARQRPDALFLSTLAPLSGSEVATMAADTLDWPAVTGVTAIGGDNMAVDVAPDLEEEETAVQRKLATGRQEVLGVSFPAVLGIDSGFANPRRADLETAVAGRRADIETIPLEDVAPSETPFSMSVGRATLESVFPNTRWGRGSPPREGSVEDRIYQMLGRTEGDGDTGGELIEAPPEEAAEHVLTYLRRNDLL